MEREYFISQGCLDGVDAAFGIHIWSGLTAPLISVEAGPRMAACDNFELVVHGTAAHGASPHLGCDGIAAAAAAVTALQGYVARRHDVFQPLVVTIGSIHGGEAPNILADTVTLSGTAGASTSAPRPLHGDLEALFSAACLPYGCTAQLHWHSLAPAWWTTMTQHLVETLASRPHESYTAPRDWATWPL